MSRQAPNGSLTRSLPAPGLWAPRAGRAECVKRVKNLAETVLFLDEKSSKALCTHRLILKMELQLWGLNKLNQFLK